MALKTSYDDSNKVVQNGRVVRYSSVPTFKEQANSGHTPLYWTVTRNSTMTYSYIGMTKSAAETCAKDLNREFTRMYMRWTANVVDVNGSPTVLINQDRTFECTSSIQPSLVAGDSWSVTVSVNETDQIISLEEITNTATLESLFQSAEQRDYPSATGSLAIVSAKWASTYISVEYSHVINSFDKTKVGVEAYESGEWTPVANVVHPTDTTLRFPAEENKRFRLTYNGGDPRSAEWTTCDYDLPKLVIEKANYSIDNDPLSTLPDVIYRMGTSYSAVVHIDGSDGLFSNSSNLKFYVYNQGSPSGKVVDLFSATPMGGGSYLLKSQLVHGVDCDTADIKKEVAISWIGEVTSDRALAQPNDGSIVITSIECLGHDSQRETSTTAALKYRALFTTTLPDADALAAEMRTRTIYEDSSAASGSTTCMKVSNGLFSITWSVSGLSKTSSYWSMYFYARVNSSSVDHDSPLVLKSVTAPKIEIVSVSNSPALSIEFTQKYGSEFDIANLKVYRFVGNSEPTSLDDPYVETNYQLSNGKLLIVDGISGIFQLRYLNESSSEVIGPNVNAILFRGFTEVGDGTYIADYERQSDAWGSGSVYLCKDGELTVSYDTTLFPTIKFTPDAEANFYFIEYYAGQTRFYSRARAIED